MRECCSRSCVSRLPTTRSMMDVVVVALTPARWNVWGAGCGREPDKKHRSCSRQTSCRCRACRGCISGAGEPCSGSMSPYRRACSVGERLPTSVLKSPRSRISPCERYRAISSFRQWIARDIVLSADGPIGKVYRGNAQGLSSFKIGYFAPRRGIAVTAVHTKPRRRRSNSGAHQEIAAT